MMVFGDSVDANQILDVCAEATAHGIQVSSAAAAIHATRPGSHLQDKSCSQVWAGIIWDVHTASAIQTQGQSRFGRGLCKAQH